MPSSFAGGSSARARACVIACGANYALQRTLGLGLPRVFLQSAQMELPAGRLGDVEIRFGHDVAPLGFGWVVPVRRDHGSYARVGVMCGRDSRRHFDRLLREVSPRWAINAEGPGGSRLTPRQKILPLAPIPRTFADRVLAIGDAAGLVKATTGGGIYYSLVSGDMAADVLTGALTPRSTPGRRPRAVRDRRGVAGSVRRFRRSSGCGRSRTGCATKTSTPSSSWRPPTA